jgi:hypothetical protein
MNPACAAFAELDFCSVPMEAQVLAQGLVGAGEQAGRWWIGQRKVSKEEAVGRFLSQARGTVTAAFAAMDLKESR